MKEFVGLRSKTYAYLMDDDSEKRKVYYKKKTYVWKLQILFV